jgi:hypothetical protein
MNPNLIPAAVNVVIGDNLYELKFRVELNSNDSSLQPMDMDRRPEDGGADSRDEAETGVRSNGRGLAHKSSQAGQGGNSGGNSSLSGKGASWALPTFSLHMPLASGDGGAAPVLGFAAVYGQEGAIGVKVERGMGISQGASVVAPVQIGSKALITEEVRADGGGGVGVGAA